MDVSIQAQVVNLLKDVQKKLGLTLLFIAHDLSMVRYISDRVAVMYLGKLMEVGTTEDFYANPLHPYTKALLSAIPIADPDEQRKRVQIELEGDVPSPINMKPGCRFVDRCPYGDDTCRGRDPEMEEILPGQYVACFKVRKSIKIDCKREDPCGNCTAGVFLLGRLINSEISFGVDQSP